MALPVDHVAMHARLRPGAVAMRELQTGRQWSYAELDTAIARAQAKLVRDGVGRADRVALLSRNRPEFIVLHLACARLGAAFVPLNWRLAPAELQAVLADCDPALLLGDETLDRAGWQGAHIDDFFGAIGSIEPATADWIDRTLPSLILYTSGTSGRPKGVVLTEANLDQSAIGFSLLGQVDRQSVFLCDAPMFHVIGLVTNVRPALMRGATLLISDGFDAERTLGRLSDHHLGISHYFCVPQMAARLRAVPGFDPRPLRLLTGLFTGGAAHAPDAVRRWLDDGVAAVDGYGMTEAGTVSGMPLDRSQIRRKAGAVGIAAPYVQVRLGAGDELQLRGPNIMRGYWRNPQASAACRTEDGWFRTGDIAAFDEDGFCWLKGRAKEMFISGGENVYPAEIETALEGHPSVRECAVIGVPDARWGEVGCLFVAWTGQPAEEAVLAHLRDRLAGFKIPHVIRAVEALPRNGTGKVAKAVLAEMADQSGKPT